MSLIEEVHWHPGEKYIDFEDDQHVMAVFGLAARALETEVELELEQMNAAARSLDTDN